MRVIVFLTLCVLVFSSTVTLAEDQLPLNFRGLTSLEIGPQGRGGAQDDLVVRRSHRGHAAADVHSGFHSVASALATTAVHVNIPHPQPQRVIAADTGFVGFPGLNHFDQRNAGTGKYANTNFSLEPPDQGLCVGQGFVMEVVNDALAVYSTSGSRLAGPVPLSQFFQLPPGILRSSTPPVFGPFISDPRCYFDPGTRRWFVTELEIDTDPNTGAPTDHSSVLIAVSQTSDPVGDYDLFSIDTTDGNGKLPGHPGCPCFGDQPLIGADANGFYITTNEFPIQGGSFNGAQVYAVSKAALVGGNLGTVVHINAGAIPVPLSDRASGGLWYSIQPATSPTAISSGTEYFLSALQFGPAPFDNRIAVWALTNTASLAGEPDVHLLHIVITTESYGMAPQNFSARQRRGPSPLRDALGDVDRLERLDGNDDRMNQVVFAAGDLWGGVNTSVAGEEGISLGIAWFDITPSLNDGRLSAAVHNQGYVTVAEQNVIYPSIGVNESGRAVLTFTLSGPRYFPTAAYSPVTGQAGNVRVAGAGLGPEDGFTGYSTFRGNGIARWGDYSAAVADANGDIWIAAEYIGQTCILAQFSADRTCGGTRSSLANWGTFIGRVPIQ